MSLGPLDDDSSDGILRPSTVAPAALRERLVQWAIDTAPQHQRVLEPSAGAPAALREQLVQWAVDTAVRAPEGAVAAREIAHHVVGGAAQRRVGCVDRSFPLTRGLFGAALVAGLAAIVGLAWRPKPVIQVTMAPDPGASSPSGTVMRPAPAPDSLTAPTSAGKRVGVESAPKARSVPGAAPPQSPPTPTGQREPLARAGATAMAPPLAEDAGTARPPGPQGTDSPHPAPRPQARPAPKPPVPPKTGTPSSEDQELIQEHR